MTVTYFCWDLSVIATKHFHVAVILFSHLSTDSKCAKKKKSLFFSVFWFVRFCFSLTFNCCLLENIYLSNWILKPYFVFSIFIVNAFNGFTKKKKKRLTTFNKTLCKESEVIFTEMKNNCFTMTNFFSSSGFWLK